jgi:hypothetical protein
MAADPARRRPAAPRLTRPEHAGDAGLRAADHVLRIKYRVRAVHRSIRLRSAEGTGGVARSTSEALRSVADLLDRLPDLPEHVVTVDSSDLQISLLFGAGPDEDLRREAVRRVLAALGGAARSGTLEYGGMATLAGYTVEVTTGYD